MPRLHEKGLISDPLGRAKSVTFTDEGLRKAQSLLRELFAKKPAPGRFRQFAPSVSGLSGHFARGHRAKSTVPPGPVSHAAPGESRQ